MPSEPDAFIARFLNLIHASSDRRIFKDNGKNDRSSRSHHIFQIKVRTTDILGRPVESLLNIVDLAGSERRENPNAEEDRRKSSDRQMTNTGGDRGPRGAPGKRQDGTSQPGKPRPPVGPASAAPASKSQSPLLANAPALL